MNNYTDNCNNNKQNSNIIILPQQMTTSTQSKATNTSRTKSQISKKNVAKLTTRLATTTATSERHQREKNSTERKYTQLIKSIEKERNDIPKVMQEMTQKIIAAEMRAERETEKNTTQQYRITELEDEILRQQDAQTSTLPNGNAKHARDAQQKLVKTVYELETKVKALQCDLQDSATALENERSSNETRHTDTVCEWDVKVAELRGEVARMKAAAVGRELQIKEMRERHDKLIERVMTEKNEIVEKLEKALREEGAVCQRLAARNTEWNTRICQLMKENTILVKNMSERDEKIAYLDSELLDAQEKVQVLGERLSECIDDQQRCVRERGEARAALRETRLDLEKLETIRGIICAGGGCEEGDGMA
mmetsp:Transcript_2435/g.3207  ORF Transcript_2435/g.3207 Transcript_2435/m.3207 type:complete len:366 (+) Transcript_2435:386-1483(+)